MRKFEFHDYCDENPQLELDIANEDYTELLKAALKYCSHFSLDYPFEMPYRMEFNSYEDSSIVTDATRQAWDYFEIAAQYDVRKFYRYNSSAMLLLQQMARSIFSFDYFKGVPENLTFYREDGSVFFTSISHEGECYLYIKNDESAEAILQNPFWKELDISVVGLTVVDRSKIPWVDD